MNILYCRECGNIFGENEKIIGETRDVDDYDNDACPDCASDDIIEIDDADLCPECNGYHEYKENWRECFDNVYSDGRALEYIFNAWTYGDINKNIPDIIESRSDLRDYIWDSDDDYSEFIKFVCGREESERQENINLYGRTGLKIPKYLLKENA